jgi:hypothetical protein
MRFYDRADHPAGRRSRSTTIPATYQLHKGPVSVTNLRVSTRDGTVVLDPQVPDGCVMSLEEDEAVALRNLLTEWLWRRR